MPTMTVLEMTQDIISDLGDDNINSINDTPSALRVSRILKSTYDEIIATRDWPHLATMMQLDSSGTTARPTHMSLPTNVQKIMFINYNKEATGATTPLYEEIIYMDPQDFVAKLNTRDEAATNVTSITDTSGVELLIVTDTAPTYYTSFDEETIVFDSYDSTVDSTLQTSKTQVQAIREATFTISDAHIPDLPAKVFPYLLAEAKSTCFEKIQQKTSAKAEQQSRRQRTNLAREKWRINTGLRVNNYGR